ncbi:hypothetical protein [Glutamicibacter ardleyensis]|uniref:hypothetical protein n=1 Tax=Glutamicibacter ardleyensis TaxID=225894 RepID=UPI003FD3A294
MKVSFAAENTEQHNVEHFAAEADTYEKARDAARAKIPQGYQSLNIRVYEK